MADHSIFRSKALQHYMQVREKTILPLFVAPPVFALYWLLLGIFVLSGLIAWFGQVPLYVSGPGLILTQNVAVKQPSAQVTALVFLPASSSVRPQLGSSALIQEGSAGPLLSGIVDTVSPGVFSPSEIQKQYAYQVFMPVIVVSVKLGVRKVSDLDIGHPISAQIQIGSQRLIALFPVLNVLLKEK